MINEKRKAALYMIIAAIFATLMAAIVKSLDGIPVFEKLFFRTIFVIVFILLIMKRRHIPIKGVNKIGLIGRALTGFISAALSFFGTYPNSSGGNDDDFQHLSVYCLALVGSFS